MKFFIFIFIFISNVFNFSYSKDDDEELLLEEKKLVEPFIFGKKDVSSNHPYSIYVTLKEVLLSEYTFHPYGLRDDPENASSQTYFLFNQLTSSEKSSIYGYSRRSIGKIINFDELLELFEKFKKPEMRFFILGNYNYPKDPLFYVKNDINLWHKISKEIFDLYDGSISIYENLTRKDFDKIFKDFIKKIQKDELVIFLYIGHAMKNGMPIFIDYESISQKDFYSYISEFQNDTLLLGDFSYIENSFKQEKNPKFYSEKKPYYRLDEGNSASFTVKENIFKFF